MTDEEKQVGRIRAVIFAAESTVESAKRHKDVDTMLMAKETAYDHIKGIIQDVGYCPWQE